MAAIVLAFSAPHPAALHAATVYWDINDTAAGAGGTAPAGAWTAAATVWNAASDGTGAAQAWTAGDIAAFAAGADATGAYTVTLDATQSIGGLRFEEGLVTLSGGTLSLAADAEAFVASGVQANISSLLAGSARLAKTGDGTLVLSGDSTGFSGVLALQAGTLRAIGPGTKVLGAGSLELTGGTLHLMNDANISLGRPTTLNGVVSIIADRITSSAGDTTYTFGTLNVAGPSTLNLSRGSNITGSVYGRATYGATTVAGDWALNLGVSSILTLGAITESGGARSLTLSGGSSSSSILILNGTSTLSGGFTMNSGRVYAAAANAIGAAGSTTTVNAGNLELRHANAAAGVNLIYAGTATLSLTSNATVDFNVGSFTHTGGNLTITAGRLSSTNFDLRTHTFSNALALNGNLTLNPGQETTLVIAGAISEQGGSRTLTKTGVGILQLNAAASHTGLSTLSNGTLRLGVADALPSGVGKSGLSIAPATGVTTVFDLNGFNQTLNSLSSSGAGTSIVDNVAATAATLTLGAGDGSGVFLGTLQDSGGALSLVKTGSGIQVLRGISTHEGGTLVTGGVLGYGSKAAQSPTGITQVGPGGTLALGMGGAGYYTTADIDALFANTFANVTMDTSAGVGIDTTQGSVTYATSQGGSRALVKLGPNALTLTGTNTYTGGTVVNEGTLIVASDANLGASSGGLFLGAGTTLQITGSGVMAPTRSVTLAGAATFDITQAATAVTISGNLTPAALTKAGAGTLRLPGNITGSGNLTVTAGMLVLGGAADTGTGATSLGSAATLGRLLLEPGASLSTATVAVGTGGADYRGALVIRGGTLTATTTSTSSGISLGATGYGGMFLSSGTVNTKRVDSLDGSTAASIAILQVSGGTLNTSNYIMFRNQRWEFTVTGGEVLRTGDHIALGYRGGATAQGVMTVAGGTVNNTNSSVTMGQQNNATSLATTHLNLNAGLLITNSLLNYNSAGAATQSYVNFNGGLLRASASASSFLAVTGTGGSSTLTAYVNGAFGSFAGGAFIDSNGFNITIPVALRAPTGDGVSTIPVANGGSGYFGAPYVEISGGGGSGATATATVDLDPASPTYGQLLSIMVTNPGVGYTSAPTITLLGGGGSGAVIGTVTTAANTSGGLTKSGTGTLTLSGASTYTGGTAITGGTLALGADNALPAGGPVTISGGATFDLNTRSNLVGAVTLESGSITSTTGALISNADFNLQSGSVTATLSGAAGVAKSTSGTVVLSAANSFSGPVSVSGGTLSFATSSNLGSGSSGNTLSLSGGGRLAYTGTEVQDLGASRGLTLGAGGGTIDVAAGFGGLVFSGGVSSASAGSLIKTGAGSLVLPGTTNLNGGAVTLSGGSLQAGFGSNGISALTLGADTVMDFRNGAAQALAGLSTLAIGDGARLQFEMDGSAVDSLSALLAATVTGTITLDLFSLGSGPASTTYTLFSAASGLSSASYVIGSGISGWNFTLDVTDTLVSLIVSPLQNYYWRGGQNASWSTLGSGTANWTSDAAGSVNAAQIPGAGAGVVFSASGAPFSSGTEITTTLDAPFTIDSLRFESSPSGVSAVTVLPGTGGVLTLAPQSNTGGIEVLANAGAITIAAPVVVAQPQTWQVADAGASLAITGGITFTEAVKKSGAGAVTLSGSNTGAGGVLLSAGTLNLNSAAALGSGVLTIEGGALGSTGGGGVTLNNNAQVWNGSFAFSGPDNLNLGSGAVTLGRSVVVDVAAASLTVGGVISSGADVYSLTKTGAGTLTVAAASTYLGTTVLDQGTLVFTATQNMSAEGNGLTFGAVAGSTSAFALDLTQASAVFRGPALVQTNNTTPNTITIGSGQELRLNGSLTVGYDSGTVTKTRLTLSGAGTFKIGDSGTPTNANVQIGNSISTSVSNAAVLDMSGLAVFYANLGTGTFRVGDPSNGGGGAGTGGGGSTVILAQDSTLIATTISTDSNTLATQTLQLGTGTNVLQATNIHIGGVTARGQAVLNFYGSTGTLTVRNLAGTGRAVLNVQNGTSGTAGALSGAVDLTGHHADLLLSTLGVGGRSAGSTGAGTGSFAFDTGVLDATTVTLGSRTGSSLTSATITGTMSLGGTTAQTSVTFGSLTMSTNTVTTANSSGNAVSTLNISGIGTLNLGALTMSTLSVSGATATSGATSAINVTGGTTAFSSVTMATNSSTASAGTTASAALNISGGSVAVAGGISMGGTSGNALNTAASSVSISGAGSLSVAGGITQSGGTGTESMSVTLNGGTLDMNGSAIGSAAAPVVFNAQAGTLRSLGGLNEGSALMKTTGGTLVLEGASSHTGGATVADGTLQVGTGSTAGSLTGTGTVTVVKAGAVLADAPVLSGGAMGTAGSGVIAGAVLVGSLGDNSQRGILAPGFGTTAGSNTTLTIQGAGGLTVAGGSQLQLSLTQATAAQDAGILAALAAATYSSALDFIATASPAWTSGGPAALAAHDFVSIAGGLSLGTRNGGAGSGTVLLLDNGYTASAKAGDVFNLLDWSGVMGGTFSAGSGFSAGGVQGDFDLPALTGGLMWDTSAFADYGVVVVVPEPGLTHLLLVGLAAIIQRRRRGAAAAGA